MFISHGACPCTEVKIRLTLPDSIEQYSPRACDCDFCITKGIAYLSDPRGSLDIDCIEPMEIQRQGSNQAGFLTCATCHTVIAVSVNLEGKLIGALNSSLLSNHLPLQSATQVSPKLLSPKDKLKRWQSVWLNITINDSSYVHD
ncbi:hypothetical protein [Shewanella woodyi]|uniref:hypothetical protein n=1 Tax=Shewanella woodyi TaxID=60961 RepID=UPI00374868F6